jgi:hypothetical protein
MTRSWAPRKAVLAIVLLMSLLGLATLTLAAPAKAAGCFAMSCNGLDPNATGCASDARTLDDVSYATMRVELRYSDTCNAAWARVSPTANAYGGLQGVCDAGSQGWVTSPGGVQYVPTNWACSSSSAFSRMVSDTVGQTARACVRNNYNISGCTRSI